MKVYGLSNWVHTDTVKWVDQLEAFESLENFSFSRVLQRYEYTNRPNLYNQRSAKTKSVAHVVITHPIVAVRPQEHNHSKRQEDENQVSLKGRALNSVDGASKGLFVVNLELWPAWQG